MRILIVNKYYHVVGGVERYIKELTWALERRGHEVIPFSVVDPANEPSLYADHFVTPIKFFNGDCRPAPWTVAERVIYSREARQKMARLVEETQPDVAHLHNIYHHISPSVLHALREHSVPVLMTLHDYKLVCPTYKLWVDGEICERCRGGRFYQCVLHRCSHGSLPASLLNAAEAYTHGLIHIYDVVDLFVSPSRFLREKHIAHGIAPDRIIHIPNFLVVEDYVPCFDHGGYFAYVGRLTPFKGVGTLLEAVACLKPSFPLLIVGDGPSRKDLEVKAARLGLDNARFLGRQSGATLQDLIARAMFIVVPSEWYENCPYAVLEAFALGTPVLATAIGGIPELVENGINGLLVPPGAPDALAEGLQRMLEAGESLSEMGHAGRERMEFLSEERHLSALFSAYARIGASVLHL
jgi:glycosyltransferase involved in cell wall biosynthesis